MSGKQVAGFHARAIAKADAAANQALARVCREAREFSDGHFQVVVPSRSTISIAAAFTPTAAWKPPEEALRACFLGSDLAAKAFLFDFDSPSMWARVTWISQFTISPESNASLLSTHRRYPSLWHRQRVTLPLMIPLISALAVLLLVSLAEWLHLRRIRVAARLAFGPAGAARDWTRAVPILRVISLAAFAWGVVTLLMMKMEAPDDTHAKGNKAADATRLVFVADLSPSMFLQDAGPDGTQTRQARMREVVEGILQRVSGNLRFGVIGFYTESLPVVMEARDPELVRNVFNGLPLSYGMPIGKTDLGKAVNATLELVADFPPGSTRMIIFTDGDSVNLVPILPRPKSVKEVLVLGVGNPHKGTYIDGHQSRQEGETLQQVATSLMGTYEDVNTKHLATSALGNLVVPLALPHSAFTLAQLAVFAMAFGALINALIPLALEYFGSDWKVSVPERRAVKSAKIEKEAALAR